MMEKNTKVFEDDKDKNKWVQIDYQIYYVGKFVSEIC